MSDSARDRDRVRDPDSARNSDRILAEAHRSLNNQRAGGRRRSIGKRSAALKRRHYMAKLLRIGFAVAAIVVAAMVAGLLVDGIGFAGLMATALAIVVAAFVLGRYPQMHAPDVSQLNTGNVRSMVGKTELWLEAQRPALPAPAVRIVDQLGVQLDTLGLQLEGIDPAQPAVSEIRKLVGEHLPGTIETWRRIPAHLRSEARGGQTPDSQLTEALGKISAEVDEVTRQLAAGDLDNLAIRTRYLDYRYGNAMDEPETPA